MLSSLIIGYKNFNPPKTDTVSFLLLQ